MEALIIFIIMGILGSLMSKNKDKQQNSMPPFNNRPNTTTFGQNPKQGVEQRRTLSKPTTLEDFAKEAFEQLNEKTNQSKEMYNGPKYNEVTNESKVQKNTKPVVPETNRDSRLTLGNNRSTKQSIKQVDQDVIKQSEIGSYVPNTKQALIQAIVASEIIGPPKAKQR